MTDPFDSADPLRGLRDRPVELLPPRPDAFRQVRAAAGRRRRRSRLGSAAATVVALAALGALYPVLRAADLAFAPTGSNPPARGSAAPTPLAVPGAVGGPVPAGFRPQSVTFAATAVGWALGHAPCRKEPCTSVVRTTDAGRGWRGVPAPRTVTATSPKEPSGVSELRFGSLLDGFAYGPELWATHDGALSWHRVPIGRVLDLEIASRRAYAVVSGCPSAAGCGRPDRLLTSAVGSDTWRTLPVGLAADGPVSLSVGPGASYLLQQGAVPAIYRADGTTWQAATVPCPDAVTLTTAGAPDNLAMVCRSGAAFRSGDGGSSWTPAGNLASAAGGVVTSSAAAAGSPRLFVSTAPAGAVGAAASRPAVAASDDDGVTWRPVLGGAGFSYVGFTTPSQGFALPSAPDGRIWFSYDAGAHWSAYRFH